MAANGSLSIPEHVSTTSSGDPQGGDNLGKDEVAWFFVEQYYTTLSKTPEKLHLFYGKRSQFVFGREAEVANVSVGRQTIQDRIKALDFQDCKVRVSNVDSQTSFENIVIQVIGETSNKAGDPKKFVQTFVLAQQPSGYFVLNDILRYIDEEGDEETTETREEDSAAKAPAADKETEAVAMPVAAAPSTEEAAAPSLDADVVDKKLEVAEPEPVNGEQEPEVTAEPTQTQPKAEEAGPDPEATAKALAEEDAKEAEKPVDPSPTPVVKAEAPAPAVPAQPPKPMTWASRAAAAATPKPAVPLPKTATPPAQPKAAAPAVAATSAQPSAPATETSAPAAPAKEASSEWQTAGNESKRQNRPQSISGPQVEKDGTMGYVKYVTEKVKHEDLKSALAQHGELVYFDINRQKNCAFVEFATTAGYQAAVTANPHTVNGESIMVEPRRPKASAYGGTNYASNRGGAGNRGGRGAFDGGRSGSQGGRGNFGGQNRGRGGAPRGRGASQATNA